MRVSIYPDFHTQGATATAFYRLLEPMRVLQAAGYDFAIGEGITDRTTFIWQEQYDPQTRVRNDRIVDSTPLDCDIAIFQRPVTQKMYDAVRAVKKHCLVGVEIDDDFQRIPRDNAAYAAFDPAVPANRYVNWNWAKAAVDEADFLIVTTPALAKRYGRRDRPTYVIPNYVPERYIDEGLWRMPGYTTQLGWTGNTSTHPHDLEATGGVVGEVLAETGAQLHIVGAQKGIREQLGLDPGTFITDTGFVPLDAYPSLMAEIDVGMVPLDKCAFNHAKSWLKGIEFAALGVPFVASATEPYIALEKLGAGAVARRPVEWKRELIRLVNDVDYRAERAEAGRDVARTLTYEQNAIKWWDACSAVLARKKIPALT